MRFYIALAYIVAFQSGFFVADSNDRATKEKLEHPMKSSVLDTKMGLFGADISPDGRYIAVDATKGATERGGINLTEEIQIWEWREVRLVNHKILSTKWLSDPNDYVRGERFVRYSQKEKKIVICRNGHLQSFDSESLLEINDIDLGGADWPKFSRSSAALSYVADVEIDQSAHRAAVLLAWGPYGGGQLRIYDLALGKLVRQWQFEKVGFPDRGPISLDSDGRRVAIAVLPFSPGERRLRPTERNVSVLEIDSGEIRASINTGYIAGAVCLARNNTLLSVSLNPDVKRFRHDTLKIWSSENGSLIRELRSEPEGVHDSLHLSSDGRLALGYIGLEKHSGDSNVTTYQRLRIWDLPSGEIVATSPDLLPMYEGGPRFRFSGAGNVVLVYPVGNSDILRFYEIL